MKDPKEEKRPINEEALGRVGGGDTEFVPPLLPPRTLPEYHYDPFSDEPHWEDSPSRPAEPGTYRLFGVSDTDKKQDN